MGRGGHDGGRWGWVREVDDAGSGLPAQPGAAAGHRCLGVVRAGRRGRRPAGRRGAAGPRLALDVRGPGGGDRRCAAPHLAGAGVPDVRRLPRAPARIVGGRAAQRGAPRPSRPRPPRGGKSRAVSAAAGSPAGGGPGQRHRPRRPRVASRRGRDHRRPDRSGTGAAGTTGRLAGLGALGPRRPRPGNPRLRLGGGRHAAVSRRPAGVARPGHARHRGRRPARRALRSAGRHRAPGGDGAAHQPHR